MFSCCTFRNTLRPVCVTQPKRPATLSVAHGSQGRPTTSYFYPRPPTPFVRRFGNKTSLAPFRTPGGGRGGGGEDCVQGTRGRQACQAGAHAHAAESHRFRESAKSLDLDAFRLPVLPRISTDGKQGRRIFYSEGANLAGRRKYYESYHVYGDSGRLQPETFQNMGYAAGHERWCCCCCCKNRKTKIKEVGKVSHPQKGPSVGADSVGISF